LLAGGLLVSTFLLELPLAAGAEWTDPWFREPTPEITVAVDLLTQAMAAHAARRPDEGGTLITVANNDCIRASAKSWNRCGRRPTRTNKSVVCDFPVSNSRSEERGFIRRTFLGCVPCSPGQAFRFRSR
jgi:hypothetical protein